MPDNTCLESSEEILKKYRWLLDQGWGNELQAINLHDQGDWEVFPFGIGRRDKAFFEVKMWKVKTRGREISEWSQPLIKEAYEPNGNVGLLLAPKKRGQVKALVQFKAEPGNLHTLQLSPTVQATLSNSDQLHGGDSPTVFTEFMMLDNTLWTGVLSEDGGRFFQKKNVGWLKWSDGEIGQLPANYCWVSLDLLFRFLVESSFHCSLINPHLRDLMLICRAVEVHG